MLPTFELKVRVQPSYIREGFYEILLFESNDITKWSVVEQIEVEMLTNKSFRDHLWKQMKFEIDKVLKDPQ